MTLVSSFEHNEGRINGMLLIAIPVKGYITRTLASSGKLRLKRARYATERSSSKRAAKSTIRGR